MSGKDSMEKTEDMTSDCRERVRKATGQVKTKGHQQNREKMVW